MYISFLCKSYTSAQNRNANFKNTLYFLQLCVSSMRRIFCLYLSCPNKGCSRPYSPLLFINMANVRAVVVIKWKLINWELYSFNGSMDCHHNDQLWFLHLDSNQKDVGKAEFLRIFFFFFISTHPDVSSGNRAPFLLIISEMIDGSSEIDLNSAKRWTCN